jgi:hypothetical protein
MAQQTINMKKKLTYGASVFDFDETIGFSDNVVYASKDNKTIKITSDEWPKIGAKMIDNGWKMNFDDFNKVTNGKPGPLINKLRNQIKKYGNESIYILTARHSDSEEAIMLWLLVQNIELKRENIVGLGDSTGKSKAKWIQDNLINNGINDIYFVDDAFSNVKAVKDMFEEYPKGFLIQGGKSIITN